MASPSTVFVLSHNNAREGAPIMCAKLASALRRTGDYERVALRAAARGPNPENFGVVALEALARDVADASRAGKRPVLVLSTVVTCRFAKQIRGAIEAAGGDRDGYRIVGMCHEVRNETFSWVRPEHLDGLDHIVFVARYTMDTYGPEYAPSTPRTVILNWLSPAEKQSIDDTPLRPGPVVLMVGVVAPHKGQLHVAKAFAAIADRFPGHELHIVGQAYDPAYAEQVKAASDRVKLIGPLNRRAVSAAMRSCSVFVHGSPMESCCLAVLEAMYSQCAVVAARVGGIPEQIQDGRNGLLYTHGDELACARAMASLLQSPELRRELGAAARKTVVADFSERDKTEQYGAVFASAFNA